MAVRALYDMKDTPLPLAVDLYAKTIVPSIDEKSEPAYKKMIEDLEYDMFAVSKDITSDWSQSQNKLFFTQGYLDIFKNPFEEPVRAIWIAYEALTMIIICYPDFKTADLQVFHFRESEFWIKHEQDYVVFHTPAEY